MCGTCGCSDGADIRLLTPEGTEPVQAPHHHHGDHTHAHGDDGARTVVLQEKLLARNDALAVANRDWLQARGVLAVNLMSSPGAGKTTLLERAATDLAGQLVFSVIEGDQETALDADRMRRAGCRVVQVNTGTGCHLDAHMVDQALRALDPPAGSVVVIENVGNLVCPSSFVLGEDLRLVLFSVTEGEDKPLKYPTIFNTADVAIITKLDLAKAAEFDAAEARRNIEAVRPGMEIVEVSAKTGEGMERWVQFLESRRAERRF